MRQSYACIPIPCTGSYSFSPPCHKHFPASILYIKIRVPPLIIARSVPSTPKYPAILFYKLGKLLCAYVLKVFYRYSHPSPRSRPLV